MATKLELMLEAHSRGLLQGEQKTIMDEYIRRQGGEIDTPAQAETQQPRGGAYTGRRQATSAQREQGQDVPGTIMGPLTQGVTAGLGDELMGIGAGTASMFGKFFKDLTDVDIGTSLEDSGVTGESFSPYEATRDAAREDIKAFTDRNPGTALAAEIAGSVITGGAGGSRMIAKEAAKKVPASLAKISALSAGQSAAYGFGTGEGLEDSLDKALVEGAKGAVIGPTLNKLMKVAAKPFTRGAAKAEDIAKGPLNTIESLKNEAQKFYKAAENSGVRIKERPYMAFKGRLINQIDNEGVTGPVRKQLSPALRELAALKDPSYRDLEKVKIKLTAAKRGGDDAVKTYAYQISNGIDEFIANIKPNQVYKGSKISQLGPNLAKAKDLWSRKSQGETLESILEAAEDSAQASFGGNMDKAMSSAIRPYIRSKSRKSLGIDPNVKSDLRSIVRGGDDAKSKLRGLAEVAPGAGSARGLQTSLGAGAVGFAGSGGNPIGLLLSLAPGLTGEITKKMANKMTMKEFQKVQYYVLNKGRDSVNDLMDKMIAKYGGQIAGAASGTTAAGSETTGLADMTKGYADLLR